MILLAYDTSAVCLSIALYKGSQKINELDSEPGARHATVLAPMIQKLLKKSRIKLSDVDVVAVGIGPGSFTGLRVGIATAKILGYVLKKKIVGVTSLEAIAREALTGEDARIAVALDARRSRVYGAVYEQRGDKFKVIQTPALFEEKKFQEISASADRLIGKNEAPRASGIAAAAFSMIQNKTFINPLRLEPLYLQPRDCNVTLPKK